MHPNHKILLIILCFTTSIMQAQDIHFSQYFNSPLSLNPAETGRFDGDWRAYMNYRNQWSAIAYPFRTVSAGYDRNLFIGDQHFSLGAYVLNDQSGYVALKNSQVYLSTAYHRTISKNNFTGGVQFGFVMKSVRYDQILFANDWNESAKEWDPNFGSTDLDKDQLHYLDVNIGFGWSRKIRNMEIEAGAAVFHVNQPSESFDGNTTYKVPMRIAFQTSVRTNISPTTFIKPGVLYYTMMGSRNMMIGGQAGFATKTNRMNVSEIYGGLYLRNGIADPTDAMVAMVGAQIRKFTVNVSYDVNISSLSKYTNSRGAFEISLIYKSITTLVKTFTIPCERI